RDEDSLGEDTSKQRRRINAIDADEDITLVSVQDDADDEMFDVNDLGGEEVFVEQEVAVKKANDEVTITTEEITLGQALMEIKAIKPKPKKKVQIMLDEEAAKKLQAEFDEEERLAREKTEKEEEEANIALIENGMISKQRLIEKKKALCSKKSRREKEQITNTSSTEKDHVVVKGKEKRDETKLIQESAKKQKVEDDKETVELKQLMKVIPDEEEVAIDAIPLAVKSPKMLKSFDREDLEDLYKLVKDRYGSTRPVEDLDLLLQGDLKTMFEPHVEDEVWKKQQGYKVLSWKLYDSFRVHSLRMQSVHIYILVEKTYTLTPSTLSMMLTKKLEIDYQRRIVGIKSLLDAIGITVAQVCVNAAQLKLVLLRNFKKIF
ncbi:hypothetical protein Tco_1169894, partial [Tanacetum coccineum]